MLQRQAKTDAKWAADVLLPREHLWGTMTSKPAQEPVPKGIAFSKTCRRFFVGHRRSRIGISRPLDRQAPFETAHKLRRTRAQLDGILRQKIEVMRAVGVW